jgi:hypothetical protein
MITTQLVEGQIKDFNYDKDINAVIGEGIIECYDLKNDSCIAVMSTLNEICRVAYFPNCFGNESWAPYMKHLKEMIEEGHIQREDPYVTLNNEHYGNNSIQFQWKEIK